MPKSISSLNERHDTQDFHLRQQSHALRRQCSRLFIVHFYPVTGRTEIPLANLGNDFGKDGMFEMRREVDAKCHFGII